jgi:hypothetical protein
VGEDRRGGQAAAVAYGREAHVVNHPAIGYSDFNVKQAMATFGDPPKLNTPYRYDSWQLLQAFEMPPAAARAAS